MQKYIFFLKALSLWMIIYWIRNNTIALDCIRKTSVCIRKTSVIISLLWNKWKFCFKIFSSKCLKYKMRNIKCSINISRRRAYQSGHSTAVLMFLLSRIVRCEIALSLFVPCSLLYLALKMYLSVVKWTKTKWKRASTYLSISLYLMYNFKD